MDTNILRKDHPESSARTDEMVETHYAALERAACPFCYEGWVYMGYEGVDEDGEHVEVIERVACRRCNRESLSPGPTPIGAPAFPEAWLLLTVTVVLAGRAL